ncbi:MAG TPA: type II secretion system protein [Geobacteraceae bacterium]|nr:type II secretion system protein [Geobacteraceae bacterium]
MNRAPFAPLSSCRGFTYLAALVVVVIMGIMLSAGAKSWTMVMKREREQELLFRGKQIVEAIARWQNPPVPAGAPKPPVRPLNDLKDLLTDPNSLTKTHYLRKDPATSYNDPITGKEWETIKIGGRGIVGVKSTSGDAPVKQGGFLEMFYPLDPVRDAYLITMFKNFEGKTKYSDWQFVWNPQAATGSVPLPGQQAGTISTQTTSGGMPTMGGQAGGGTSQ